MMNHGLAAKLATDLLFLRSLGNFTSSLSAGIKALSLKFLLPGISRQQTIFLSDLRFFVQWFNGSIVPWSSVTAALCSQRFA